MLETTFENAFDGAVDRLNAGCEESITHLRLALDCVLKAESELSVAASKVYETPDDDRIVSLNQTLEDFEIDLKAQIKRMGELT